MNALTIVYGAALAIVLMGLIPAVYVLTSEAIRRLSDRRGLRRLVTTRHAIEAMRDRAPADAAETLRATHRPVALDQALRDLLRQTDDAGRPWLAAVADRLGVTARYIRQLRESPRWSDRVDAAEALGLLGLSVVVGPLVTALRDPEEDGTSVKTAAATALGRVRDPAAIPALVASLVPVDDAVAPHIADALAGYGPAAVAPLIDALNDEKQQPAGRVWAARILGRLGDHRATPALVARLSDRRDVVRMAAAEALGGVRDRAALQPLVQAVLHDPSPQVRAFVTAALGRLGDESATGVLISALADPDHGTRVRALEALELLGSSRASLFRHVLADPQVDVRRRGALVMERSGYLTRRIADLASEDAAVVRVAYSALLDIGRAGLWKAIARSLDHENHRVRAAVARALGEIGEREAGAPLVDALRDPSALVRGRAAEAAGRLIADNAVEPIARLLVDPDLAVRERAAAALGRFPPAGMAAVVSALTAACEQDHPPVRQAAVELLATVPGDSARATVSAATTDVNPDVRAAGVRSLAARGWATEDLLAPLLADTAADVREAVVDALGAVPTARAMELLLGALPGAAPRVRDRIAVALAGHRREELFARVDALLRSGGDDLRLGIVWALGRTSDVRAVRVLAPFLRDGDARLRASAAGALGKIHTEVAADALLGAVGDPDGRTRAAVVNALARVGADRADVATALSRALDDPDGFVRDRVVVAVARLRGAAAEPLVLGDTAVRVGVAARATALALVGTDAALSRAAAMMAVPGTAEALRRALTLEDDEVRRTFAVRLRLPELGPEAGEDWQGGVVAQYGPVLRSSGDALERKIAVEALAHAQDDAAVRLLVEALENDPAEAVRLRAAQAVAERATDAGAQRALSRAVGDPSVDVAVVAARALARGGNTRALTFLLDHLGVGPFAAQDAVEAALAEVCQTAHGPVLERARSADRPAVVVGCIRVLERIADSALLPVFREFARAQDAGVRAAVVRAVGGLPGPEPAKMVDDACRDPQVAVRLEALEAVAGSEGGDAVRRLAVFRQDPAAAVRRRLAQVVAEVDGGLDGRALPLLEPLLTDNAPDITAAALAGLLALGSAPAFQRFGQQWDRTPADVRRYFREDLRAEALATELARRVTDDRDAVVRRLALVGVAALMQPGWESVAIEASHDPSPEVRRASARVLLDVDHPDARQRLAELADDADGTVREVTRRRAVLVPVAAPAGAKAS